MMDFTVQLKDTRFYQEIREEVALETFLKPLLTKRFGELPETICQRLENADIEQMEQWVESLVDAPSLDAVFKDSDLSNDGNE